MRFVEIVGVCIYIALISTALTNYGIYLRFDHVEISDLIKKKFYLNKSLPECITNLQLNKSVTKNSIYWLQIECLVATGYIFTMMLLMFKSRFTLIGIDQSGQFESIYLKRMCNKIIESIPFEVNDI